jgi:hypothetical protein
MHLFFGYALLIAAVFCFASQSKQGGRHWYYYCYETLLKWYAPRFIIFNLDKRKIIEDSKIEGDVIVRMEMMLHHRK